MHQILRDQRARRVRGENGFTLIELLVVVVILGVLIAIAIPVYLNYRKGANDAAAESDVRNAISVLEVCSVSNGKYPIAAATFPAGAASAPCLGQAVNTSAGTTIKYVTNTTGSTAGTCYTLYATNAGGASKFWTYSSVTGGSVTTTTSTLFATPVAPSC